MISFGERTTNAIPSMTAPQRITMDVRRFLVPILRMRMLEGSSNCEWRQLKAQRASRWGRLTIMYGGKNTRVMIEYLSPIVNWRSLA